MKRVHSSRQQMEDKRIVAAVADIMRDVGLTHDGHDANTLTSHAVLAAAGVRVRSINLVSLEHGGAVRRRIKALIALLVRQPPDWEQPVARARTASTSSALAGVLRLARVLDDPKLSAALSEAALKHLSPDGA